MAKCKLMMVTTVPSNCCSEMAMYKNYSACASASSPLYVRQVSGGAGGGRFECNLIDEARCKDLTCDHAGAHPGLSEVSWDGDRSKECRHQQLLSGLAGSFQVQAFTCH